MIMPTNPTDLGTYAVGSASKTVTFSGASFMCRYSSSVSLVSSVKGWSSGYMAYDSSAQVLTLDAVTNGLD